MKLNNKTLLPLFLCGLTSLAGGTFLPVAQAQEPNTQGTDTIVVPDAAKSEGPPLRDGDKVLFRFRAPSRATKVFVAGSFNKFAANKDGKISDDKYAMTPAGNGMYFLSLPAELKEQQYKYVFVDAAEKFTWVPDPQVKQPEKGANTVLDFAKLRSVEEDRAFAKIEKQDGPPLRDGDRVLFRFGAPAHTDLVYLAGSFNNFANNKGGVVTDDQFAMTSADGNRWFKWVLVDPKIEKYKFVVIDQDGASRWKADPQGTELDARGNTVVDFSKIEPIKLP